MLVVSRKENQSVVFPNLGISVEIIKVSGKTVRVGVDAPSEVRILRGELQSEGTSNKHTSVAAVDKRKEEHELRNRLNKANLALALVQKQLQKGNVADAEASLSAALAAFDQLDQSSANGEFTIDVPVPQAGENADVSANTTQPKRALLVEDNPNERALLASYLRASGYEVDTVEDGQAALEYLAKQKPDAVVMDMEMPRLHGSDTVREIRSDDHFDDVKLFIVSGLEQSSTKLPTGDRGIQNWFQKPLRPEELVNAMSRSLN